MDDHEKTVSQTKGDKWRLNLELGVPPDPCIWTVKETATWLNWISGSPGMYNPLGNVVVESAIDGKKLCQMTEQEFGNLFGKHDHRFQMYYRHLQYWKTVPPFTPSDECNVSLMGSAAQMMYSARLQKIDQDINNSQMNHVFTTSGDFCTQSKLFVNNNNEQSYFNDFSDISEYLYENLLQVEDTRPVHSMSQYGKMSHCNDSIVNDFKMAADNRIDESPPTVSGSNQQRQSESCNQTHYQKSTVTEPPVRKRGRPPKPKQFDKPKVKKCHPILWRFLLENLNDPKMSDCLTWVNKKNGIFKFESSRKEDIARKWGEQKGNRKLMTYQKMARALRDYSKKEIIRKHRRRLHYVFLPKYIFNDRETTFGVTPTL
ncbi:transcriptional regulator ERG-like [Ptychodera flava]|uniref:transcriptional regulator ERG-like n=1 Tax=Ptychodera flava TaxID=63121 RepID=UPI00396A4D83